MKYCLLSFWAAGCFVCAIMNFDRGNIFAMWGWINAFLAILLIPIWGD